MTLVIVFALATACHQDAAVVNGLGHERVVIFSGVDGATQWRVQAFTGHKKVCVAAVVGVGDSLLGGGCGRELYPGSGYSPEVVTALPATNRILVAGSVGHRHQEVELIVNHAAVRVRTVRREGFSPRFFVYVGQPGDTLGASREL